MAAALAARPPTPEAVPRRPPAALPFGVQLLDEETHLSSDRARGGRCLLRRRTGLWRVERLVAICVFWCEGEAGEGGERARPSGDESFSRKHPPVR